MEKPDRPREKQTVLRSNTDRPYANLPKASVCNKQDSPHEKPNHPYVLMGVMQCKLLGVCYVVQDLWCKLCDVS